MTATFSSLPSYVKVKVKTKRKSELKRVVLTRPSRKFTFLNEFDTNPKAYANPRAREGGDKNGRLGKGCVGGPQNGAKVSKNVSGASWEHLGPFTSTTDPKTAVPSKIKWSTILTTKNKEALLLETKKRVLRNWKRLLCLTWERGGKGRRFTWAVVFPSPSSLLQTLTFPSIGSTKSGWPALARWFFRRTYPSSLGCGTGKREIFFFYYYSKKREVKKR